MRADLSAWPCRQLAAKVLCCPPWLIRPDCLQRFGGQRGTCPIPIPFACWSGGFRYRVTSQTTPQPPVQLRELPPLNATP